MTERIRKRRFHFKNEPRSDPNVKRLGDWLSVRRGSCWPRRSKKTASSFPIFQRSWHIANAETTRLLFAPQTHACQAQAAIIQAPKTLIGAAKAEIS